jgi:hypothetical protein
LRGSLRTEEAGEKSVRRARVIEMGVGESIVVVERWFEKDRRRGEGRE